MRNRGRPISVTNSEVTVALWIVGFIMLLISYRYVVSFFIMFPGEIRFIIMLFVMPMGLFFTFLSMIWLPYIIQKYNLYIFTDKISNPDWMGWLRFTRNKGFRCHLVPVGPYGQTMGIAGGEKADCITQGDYTITLPNGNQAIIMHDSSSVNINLEDNEGWEMIKKHFGVIGFDGWEKAVQDKETQFRMEDVLKAMEEQEQPEKPEITEESESE